jgi:endonuclease/exonuclease/phosphatase (EEP) superfamily protein YafD
MLRRLWNLFGTSGAPRGDNAMMRRLAPLLLASTLTACAAATNYLDPEGPRYAGGPEVAPTSRPLVRIVTFNIAHARNIDGAIGCLTAPPLHEADVLLLQEMDAPGTEAIAKALATRYVYYPASVRPGEPDMGNAILSPWPIEDTRKLFLPHVSRIVHRKRIATVATVTIGGTRVRVYSVHFTSPFGQSGSVRADQAEAVLADVRDWDGPVIIGGDLNSRSVSKRFETAGFRWLTKELRKTVGLFTFDHVFVRGLETSAEPAEASVVRSCDGVSDHRPVVAELPR